MTKQHFEYFARLIRESDNDDTCKMFAALIVIRTAMEFNPRFDRDRFVIACGLNV